MTGNKAGDLAASETPQDRRVVFAVIGVKIVAVPVHDLEDRFAILFRFYENDAVLQQLRMRSDELFEDWQLRPGCFVHAREFRPEFFIAHRATGALSTGATTEYRLEFTAVIRVELEKKRMIVEWSQNPSEDRFL